MSAFVYRFDPTARGRGHRPHHFTQQDANWLVSRDAERWCLTEFGRQGQKRAIEWVLKRGAGPLDGDRFEFGHDVAAMAFKMRWG